MNISEAVIKRILVLCEKNNLSVNALCITSGVTQSTVSDIVNGITYNSGTATIKKLCDGLGITVREFFNSEIFEGLEQEVK